MIYLFIGLLLASALIVRAILYHIATPSRLDLFLANRKKWGIKELCYYQTKRGLEICSDQGPGEIKTLAAAHGLSCEIEDTPQFMKIIIKEK